MGNAETEVSKLRAELRGPLQSLASLPDGMRQVITDNLWAQIPETVCESVYRASATSGVAVQVGPQTGGLERIDSVVVSIPAGTGLVTIGSVSIPIPAGVTSFATRILAQTTDLRSVLWTAPAGSTGAALLGPVAIILAGVVQPTYGTLGR